MHQYSRNYITVCITIRYANMFYDISKNSYAKRFTYTLAKHVRFPPQHGVPTEVLSYRLHTIYLQLLQLLRRTDRES